MIFECMNECSPRVPPDTESCVISPLRCIVEGGGGGVNPPCDHAVTPQKLSTGTHVD
jgi:hypothetical protein